MNKISSKIAYALMVVACLSLGGVAQATEVTQTVDLRVSPFYLYPGQSQWINLNGWHHVKKLVLRGFGAGADAMFDVYVNGDLKGSVHLPAADPQYTVTVDETAQWVLLRHRWGGVAQINQVFAMESERYLPATENIVTTAEWSHGRIDNWHHHDSVPDFRARNRASELALEAIHIVDELQGYASYQEFGDYLLPIKKAAARCYSSSEARGPLSGDVRLKLLGLQKQIEFATEYIDSTFERERAFDLAVRLKEIADSLDHELH
jgi:hypothetical protein